MNNKLVILVRPGFGEQSDSFVGIINAINNNEYPIKFHFAIHNHAILFTADDVIKLEEPVESIGENVEKIIRLKGPHDYTKTYHPIEA